MTLNFPHFTLLKASAGSGKTYALTRRIVQFLLSEKIPKNKLRNILAITFSNNAAKEMKERTLAWLKEIYFGNREKVAEIQSMTSLEPQEIKDRAGRLIDEILENYADFQIKTIDSFMTTVFKASAIDFGYNPDFDILMDNAPLMEYAFNLFLRNVREGSGEAACLEKIIDSLLEFRKENGAFLWIPSAPLLEETKKIYRKISSSGKEVQIEESADKLETLKIKITACVEEIEKEIIHSGLNRHGNSAYKKVLPQVRGKKIFDLAGQQYTNLPVTKPAGGRSGRQESRNADAAYARIACLWDQFKKMTNDLTVLLCRTKCDPYVKIYQAFAHLVDMTKKQQGKIFIEDINSHLASYLDQSIVPDVYFRIGEIVYHFLIDEFQDTSPIQWKNLFPLIENSLSQGGTLFLVGDTKQSIYGFRHADYTIMKELERVNPFPSAEYSIQSLDTNYRSRKKILEFNEQLFKTKLSEIPGYREAGEKSGLTDYIQKAKEDWENDGYVEVALLARKEDQLSERERIQELIHELRSRGVSFRDIAILTQTNEQSIGVTSWLNEKKIPFISYSSLDIRRRKIIGEIIALIHFLDSPTDHFSFGTFIMGEIFTTLLRKEYPEIGPEIMREFCFSRRNHPPLYKRFQERFPGPWERFFDGLFKHSGFLPIYDLVTELFAVFRLFEIRPEEEGAFIKFFEVVKDFESGGFNSLADFLAEASDVENGEEDWDISVPKNIEAVNVMTIHKAKGLGFPVVIVLLYEVKNRGLDYLLEEEGGRVHLLKINQNEAACDEILQALYDRERMREVVNSLNTLYVGFTRPQRELYVIGVQGKSNGFPFSLLRAGETPPSDKPDYRPENSKAMESTEHCPLQHRSRKLEFPPGQDQILSFEERKRGDFIHRILFLIDDLKEDLAGQIQQIVDRVKGETGADYSGPGIKKLILALMNNREIRCYFMPAPGREIRKEEEYADGSGRLFRMDRVIIDPERVTVLDYKTGKEKRALEEYKAQMKNYMRIVKEIYREKEVAGLLLFIDLNEVEKVA